MGSVARPKLLGVKTASNNYLSYLVVVEQTASTHDNTNTEWRYNIALVVAMCNIYCSFLNESIKNVVYVVKSRGATTAEKLRRTKVWVTMPLPL